MANVRDLVATKEAEKGFYPTPAGLVSRMMACVDWNRVSSILEPSAGKGDLALAAANRKMTRYDSKLSDVDLDCVEIDPNLRAILREKGLRVVHDDFLSYSTSKRYSLIIMNPPFEDGAKHLMKAATLLDDGGQLVCLLNAETLKNSCNYERASLVRLLKGYEAKIEYIPDAFLDAERKTGVEVALISYRMPDSKEEKSVLMDSLRRGRKYVDMTPEAEQALTKADFVDAIVDRYQYEVDCGLALIREWRVMSGLLKSDLMTDKAYSLSIELTVQNHGPDTNNYVKAVRKKYWSALFCAPQFMSQLTSNLHDELMKRVNDLANYEFSAFNIYEIMSQMSARVNDGVEKTIMDLFDDWTRKYHWDENAQNRHYFDGWRTNDAFAVNRKVIIPLRAYTDWGSRYDKEFHAYNVRNRLEDIEKVFNYLDGGRTVEGEPLSEILCRVEKTGETRNVDTKYFTITFYKKGTAHLVFKNQDLLAKFNIFAARGKNWLPPSFGRKKYAEMNQEEQKVVKSFMGDAKKYDAVVSHADYFLSEGSNLLNLPA